MRNHCENMYIYIYITIHLSVYLHAHVCMYARTYVCMCLCVCTHVGMYVSQSTHVCMYACMYTYILIYIYIYIYIYTDTHAWLDGWRDGCIHEVQKREKTMPRQITTYSECYNSVLAVHAQYNANEVHSSLLRRQATPKGRFLYSTITAPEMLDLGHHGFRRTGYKLRPGLGKDWGSMFSLRVGWRVRLSNRTLHLLPKA